MNQNDRELFDSLKRDGDCWHEYFKDGIINSNCIHCNTHNPVYVGDKGNPNFTDPGPTDVSWLRRRIDWRRFVVFLWLHSFSRGKPCKSRIIHSEVIDSIAWFESLSDKEQVELVKEFMEGRK